MHFLQMMFLCYIHTEKNFVGRRQEVSNSLNDINIMKEQIQELLKFRDEFQEIKQLLQNHIKRDNQWQA